MHSTPLHLN